VRVETAAHELLPRLAPDAWLADPGRPAADAFLAEARRRSWEVTSSAHGVVAIHRLSMNERRAP
jgi:hypothetical protein